MSELPEQKYLRYKKTAITGIEILASMYCIYYGEDDHSFLFPKNLGFKPEIGMHFILDTEYEGVGSKKFVYFYNDAEYTDLRFATEKNPGWARIGLSVIPHSR